jgi:hypothetical protein
MYGVLQDPMLLVLQYLMDEFEECLDFECVVENECADCFRCEEHCNCGDY